MIHKYTTRELVAVKPTPEQIHTLPRHPISIVVENIRSLENVGLFFRLADAIRAEKLYLAGITGYPSLPKEAETRRPGIHERADRLINKTAIQTVPFVSWEYRKRPLSVVKKLKKQSVHVIVLELTDKSIPYTDCVFRFPVCLVVGHERRGISEGVLEAADHIVHIPMYGMGNSHNTAMACAIVAYEALRQNPKLLSPTLPLRF